MEVLVNIVTICSILGGLVWFLHQDHKKEMIRLEKSMDKIDVRMEKLDQKWNEKIEKSDQRWYELLSKFHDHDKAIDRLIQK
jgi:hypothetical protein